MRAAGAGLRRDPSRDLDNASIKASTVRGYGEDRSGIWMTWTIA
ncbi:MAG: hypothetical protein ACLQK8_12660 [Streptosporangiaceae bacterium]